MPVDANSYGTVADLERMVGELARGGSFSNGDITTSPPTPATNPTLLQVETAIDRASSMVNDRLTANGYVSPIDPVNYASAFGWASEAVSALVSARLLHFQPVRDLDVGSGGETTVDSRAASLHGQVQDFLDAIMNGTLIAEKLNSDPDGFTNRVSGPEFRDPFFTTGGTAER